jgi:hypothetical protein
MTEYIPDRFFNDLQMEQDIFNYIRHNKIPNYLQKTKYCQRAYMKNLCPELNDIIIDDCEIRHDAAKLASQLQSSISKCVDMVNVMTMSTYEPETCPVCLCVFEESNYVIPKCKHKICATCFTNNLKYNTNSGNCCVLCRTRIC